MHARLILVSMLILCGCATAPRNTVALSGTVDGVREAGARAGTLVTPPPGTNAVGGAMIGLFAAATSEGAYHIYNIHMLDGRFLEVPAHDKASIGSCIDVLVDEGKSGIHSFWKAGDITLRPSTACPK